MKSNFVRRLLKRISCSVLAGVVAATMMPGVVFADEIGETDKDINDDFVLEEIDEENSSEEDVVTEEIIEEELADIPEEEITKGDVVDGELEDEQEEIIIEEPEEDFSIVTDTEALKIRCMGSIAQAELSDYIEDKPIYAVCFLADVIDIKSEAADDSDTVLCVESGQTVEIQGMLFDDNNTLWNYVNLYYDETIFYGYVKRANLAVSDERYLSWEEEYKTDVIAKGGGATKVTASDNNGYPDINQFPESYRGALTELKKAHPKWIFVKLNTGLDFNGSVSAELGNKSLVYKTFPEHTKNGEYGTNWYYASDGILRYYMDPRNCLTEDRIFQFEQLTYNESYHTQAALETFLNNTFMKCNVPAPGMDITYGSIIWAIGKQKNVSPFHMAARIVQEQGVNGGSEMISGTYPGYEGLYNHFNIKATGKTKEEVYITGLTHARENGWTSVYSSIEGGTNFISANYISKGQDTIYLQKFNVNPNAERAVYTHQYMQNISAPCTEASSMKKLYAGSGSLDNTFVFKIPVYENMASYTTPYPTSSTSITLNPPASYTGDALKSIWVDGKEYKATPLNGGYMVDMGNTTSKSAVMYNYNENGVPVGMYVWTINHNGSKYEVYAEPELENLLTRAGFSIRITGKKGIRVANSIDQEKRKKLIVNGVSGYKLTEYGTLVMNEQNRANYSMVKNGNKVAGTVSYGYDSNGTFVNKCFDKSGGKITFTSVIVGLKTEQYTTRLSFRSYAVLKRYNQDVIVYGPIETRNLYDLSKKVIESGSMKEGTDADVYLKSIINDADKYAEEQKQKEQQ